MHHPLYYLDFPDLKKLIINNANWPSSFELVFTKKGAVESSLSEIELIRNKIAHSRPLSEDELEILVAAKAKLFAGLSQRDLDAAKEAASHAISIRKILGTLESSILSSMAAIQAGDPLTLEHLESFMLTDAWWFDDAYLGGPVTALTAFISMCRDYARIPSGIGQNHARRKWATNHEISKIAEEAAKELSQISRVVSSTYA